MNPDIQQRLLEADRYLARIIREETLNRQQAQLRVWQNRRECIERSKRATTNPHRVRVCEKKLALLEQKIASLVREMMK